MSDRDLVLNELESLTTSMDVPFHRRRDFSWLMRNVQINNADHVNTAKVLKICKYLSQ